MAPACRALGLLHGRLDPSPLKQLAKKAAGSDAVERRKWAIVVGTAAVFGASEVPSAGWGDSGHYTTLFRVVSQIGNA